MLAALGALQLPLGWAWKAAVLVLLAIHARLRRPGEPELIVRNRNGFWALPESGKAALRLSAASRYGTWWAELRLAGAQGAYRRLLCRDQLSEEDWRLLRLALKRAGSGQNLP